MKEVASVVRPPEFFGYNHDWIHSEILDNFYGVSNPHYGIGWAITNESI